MDQISLINSVIAQERSLEFEEEKRKTHRSEPYANGLAAAQPCRKERRSIFARIFQRRKEGQPFEDHVKALNNLPPGTFLDIHIHRQ